MINEYLNKTISAIRYAAEFIKDFPKKLATPGVDADISRLCQQSPAEAMKYREEVKKNGGV